LLGSCLAVLVFLVSFFSGEASLIDPSIFIYLITKGYSSSKVTTPSLFISIGLYHFCLNSDLDILGGSLGEGKYDYIS
jgi:hypothetical protein